MTVVFHYWFNSFVYFLPIAVYSSFMIAFSVFLIIASRENERETTHKKLLLIAAIITIISTSLLFIVPSSYTAYSPTVEERALMHFIIILQSLIVYIPRIISFGVLFTMYGYKNREQIGNYLMYSGLFWLVYTIWASISIFSPFGSSPQLPYILDNILNFLDFGVYIILTLILSIALWFSVIANIFLLIHAFLNKDRSLKIAGFIYFISQATIGLSFIPTYFQYL